MSDQLDWAGNDIPNIYASFVNLDPQTNHAWFASGSTVALRFNLNPGNGGATGINEVAVRKAVSYGIDRKMHSRCWEGVPELRGARQRRPADWILPGAEGVPSHGRPVSPMTSRPHGHTVPDSATAKADKLPAGADVYDILTSGGWKAPATSSYNSGSGTYKSGGNCDGTNLANCWTKGSEIIKFSVYDPVPFSDYWEDASLVSQELQALGMDVTTKPAQGYSDWNANLTGTPSAWQTAIHWGQGGSIPYTQYEDWFDYSNSTTAAHYEGYSNASAEPALQTYASTGSERHRDALSRRPTAREDHVDRRSRGAATLWSGLERVQQRQVRRLAGPVAALHGSFAERSANALHPDAAHPGGSRTTHNPTDGTHHAEGGVGRAGTAPAGPRPGALNWIQQRTATHERHRHRDPQRRVRTAGTAQPRAEGAPADRCGCMVALRHRRRRTSLDGGLGRTVRSPRTALRPTLSLVLIAVPRCARGDMG